MVSIDELAAQAKDALANLYDPVHLQTHPLVGLLALEHSSWGTAGESLRTLLRNTIAALKPPASVPAGRPEWVSYRVLWLRYVGLRSEDETCRELNISEATYFRRQREALDAVTSILWQRYQEVQATGGHGVLLPAEEARARAIHLAGAGLPQPLDLRDLLDGVERTILPLAEQHGVTLRIDMPPSLPAAYGEPSLLRQIMLSVLSECIRRSPGSTLRLYVRLRDGEMLCRMQGIREPGGLPVGPEGEDRFALGRQLLGLGGGRLWAEESSADSAALAFSMPVAKPRLVLVIDDDPATAGLYQRYLQGAYMVIEARTAEQAETLLTDAAPDLILLDVMMPHRDGWTILRALKTRPNTARIPVIVCSVIDEPDLALALGAAAVLTKPISPEDLLQTIQGLSSPEGRKG